MTATMTPDAGRTTTHEISARARLSALALCAGGIGIVVGHLLTVPSDHAMTPYLDQLAAHRTTGVIGGLLTATGAFLVVPGLVALLRLVRDRGSRLATAGAILAGVGITSLGAGDVMLTLVMGGLVHHHRGTAEALFKIADSEPMLSLPFALAPLFVVGMVLLGISLLRAQTVPLWLGALTVLGGLVVPFSTAGGRGLSSPCCRSASPLSPSAQPHCADPEPHAAALTGCVPIDARVAASPFTGSPRCA